MAIQKLVVEEKPIKVLFGATEFVTVRAFILGQAKFLRTAGIETHVFCNKGTDPSKAEVISDKEYLSEHSLQLHQVRMSREMRPFRDLHSLGSILKLIHKIRPDVLLVGTPKAGLLGIIAGAISGVPARIYVVRGLRLEGLSGFAYRVSLAAERVACRLSTGVVCVSTSLLEELVMRGITTPDKAIVLGSGSSNGIDTNHFRPPTIEERALARSNVRIPINAKVIGFAGRLTLDKGIQDLIRAVSSITASSPEFRLVIAGTPDAVRPLPPAIRDQFKDEWCISLGEIPDMRAFYWTLDAFCLPSYREGMPNVNLEAAACGLPVITTNATGCRDSVINGETGIIVAKESPDQLAEAIESLLAMPMLAADMGAEGRRRVIREYEQIQVWNYVLALIKKVVHNEGRNGK
jgi:glycosyltransferase involved in cell wall biosynthesis